MNMYYIAIVLPKDLDEQIIKFKYYMLEKFEAKVGLKSPAHITIVPPFWLPPEKEEGLRSDLDSLARTLHPFPMATRDFSAFKPRTIYIDVVPSEPLDEVKKRADRFFSERPPVRHQAREPRLQSPHYHCHARPAQGGLCRGLAPLQGPGVPERMEGGRPEPAAAQ